MFGRGLDRIKGPCMLGIMTVWFCLMANAPYFPGVGVGKGGYIDSCIKQTGCLPFVQVAPKRLPFAQDTIKQRYLSRKATMGIFGLYERSHIRRY